MTAVGMKKISIAKEKGNWQKTSRSKMDYQLTTKFRKILTNNPKAYKYFNSLAPSYKRNYISWVMSAKRESTQQRRFNKMLGRLEKNKKLGLV